MRTFVQKPRATQETLPASLKKIAARLFQLVNIIIEKMVSEPREIKALFDNLREGQKNQIARRDAGKSG